MSEKAQARLDQLCTEYDALAELIEHGAADDDAEDKKEAIEAEIEIIKARTEGYAADDIARAGVSIWLDYSGDVSIYRGLLRNDDVTAKPSVNSKDGAAETEKAAHSAALLQPLTAHKTAALQIEMMHNSEIALVAVVHSLLLSAFYSGASSQSCLQITVTKEYLDPLLRVAEVKGTDVAAKVGAMKKAEAAAYAEAQLAESQWLPEPVRVQGTREADQDEVSAAA